MNEKRFLHLLLIVVLLMVCNRFFRLGDAKYPARTKEDHERVKASSLLPMRSEERLISEKSDERMSRENESNAWQRIAGYVFDVDTVTLSPGFSPGLQLMLQTNEGVVPVYLGPRWNLERQELKIVPGDRVVVGGARVPFDGHDVVMANVISKNEQTFNLMPADALAIWIELFKHCADQSVIF